MQAFQMEQWGQAIPVLVEMLDKQEKMLEKQDTTIHTLQSVNEDTSDMKSTLTRMETVFLNNCN